MTRDTVRAVKSVRTWSLLLSVLLCLLVAACSSAQPKGSPEAQADVTYLAGNPKEVAAVILHTNDVHTGFEDNIGYDGLALYKKELEEQYDHVLLVDAGDAVQGGAIGAISKGQEIIKMMNYLGYDLAIPGNHEFDFGFDVLDECADELACGYTCADFCVTGGDPVFEPWKIIDVGDIKIGFVGVVTPSTFTKSSIKDLVNDDGSPMYDFLADETGEKLIAALQDAIDEVHKNDADYVILVSHLGNSDSSETKYRCDHVAQNLSGLDMVIDGHSHEIYNKTVTCKDGHTIPIAQTGTKLQSIGQLTIYKDGRLEETLVKEVPKPVDLAYEVVTRNDQQRFVDPDMKAFMDEIVDSYADVMDQKVGYVSYDLLVRTQDGFDVSRVEENGLCDLVADAYRDLSGSQAALVNAGSVRNNLMAGEITFKNVLDTLPYYNDVITVKLSGQALLDALEFGVSSLPKPSAKFPQVSGITYSVNRDIESSVKVDEKNQFVSVEGERRVSNVQIVGEPLDLKKEYTLTGSSYTLTGGDGYTMFKDAELVSMTMLSENEALMKYIEESLDGVIPAKYQDATGRIVWLDADEQELAEAA